MRFLITSNSKHFVPPDLALPLMDAFLACIQKYTAAGKIERSWAFAGVQGGGAILNVDSLEELNAVLLEFPLGPFSDVQVAALVDLGGSIQQTRQQLQAMMGQMGGRQTS